MESTREYVSSVSGGSAHVRTTGFTSTRDDLTVIKEQSTTPGTPRIIFEFSQCFNHSTFLIITFVLADAESSVTSVTANKAYEEQMRAKIQAVHAQSPRTVQRNVDQITTEIKNNCDLRIPFKLNTETCNDDVAKVDSMDCEYQEPMEEVEEEEFVVPTGDINPFDKSLIAGLLRKVKFPQSQHSDGYSRLHMNLNKIVPSSMITLGKNCFLANS